MFKLLFRLTITCLFSLAAQAHAAVIEAEGRALILNKDIVGARQAAIQDASQAASLQAAAYISTTQKIKDGILEIDNMHISTLGLVKNVEVIDEKIIGQSLIVKIRAEVDVDQGCKNGSNNAHYQKTIAITAFPLQRLSDASIGALTNIQSGFATDLSRALNSQKGIEAFNAGHLSLYQQNVETAATRQLSDGALTSVLQQTRQLDVQYIISGVIRDMTLLNPNRKNQPFMLIDLYDRFIDYKGSQHKRAFIIDLFVHDGFSGALLINKQYQTVGLWNRPVEMQTGYGTAAFWNLDYGKQINKLIGQATEELQQELRCMPFSVRITRTEGNQIWLNAGHNSGLKPGDKLTVYRKSTFYTENMRPNTQLTNTRSTVTIVDVQAGFSVGQLNGQSQQYNIQPDDIVFAW
mgnify:CR=1 FL=1